MAQKNPKPKPDSIKSPKKISGTQIQVSNRSFLDHSKQSLPSEDPSEPQPSGAPILGPSKHIDVVLPSKVALETVIEPRHAAEAAKPEPLASDDPPKDKAELETEKPSSEAAKTAEASAPEKPELAPSAPPEAGKPNGPSETPAIEPEEPAEVETDKPSPETLKADAEAAEQERKLEEYSETGQYFVPIDAVAQKRSIKVSVILTLIVLLLAFVLIDLMLDSGIILLLQKVPHTHFFTLTSGTK